MLFDVHPTIFCFWVLGLLLSFEFPYNDNIPKSHTHTHTPRCSTLTPRFSVSAFWVCVEFWVYINWSHPNIQHTRCSTLTPRFFRGPFFREPIFRGTTFRGPFFRRPFSADFFSGIRFVYLRFKIYFWLLSILNHKIKISNKKKCFLSLCTLQLLFEMLFDKKCYYSVIWMDHLKPFIIPEYKNFQLKENNIDGFS